jgi:hypothetical protein
MKPTDLKTMDPAIREKLEACARAALFAAFAACHPTTDPALTAAEKSCVVEAGTLADSHACRNKVRAAWAKAHDASAAPLSLDGGTHG